MKVTRTWSIGTLICVVYSLAVATPPAKAAPFVVDVDFAEGALAAAWSANGQLIATQGAEGIAIRNATNLHLRRFLSAKSIGIDDADSSNTSKLVAWYGNNLILEQSIPNYDGNPSPGSAFLISAQDGRPLARFRGAMITPDHQTLFLSKKKGQFRVLNFAGQRWFDVALPLRQTDINPTQSDADFAGAADLWEPQINFSPNGRYAADQLGDGRMRLWDIKTRKVTATLHDTVSGAYPSVMAPIVWSPDGTWIATLGEDPSHHDIYFEEGPNDGTINQHPPVVKIWDARSGTLLEWISTDYGGDDIRLSWLDNDRLFVGGSDGFQIRSVSRKSRLIGPTLSKSVAESGVGASPPFALAPDHTRVFAHNRFFFLNSKRSGWPSRPIFRAPLMIEDLAWSKDGNYLAASFEHRNESGVQVWHRTSHGSEFSLVNLGLFHSPMRIGWTHSGRVWCSNFYAITYWNQQKDWKVEVWRAPLIRKAASNGRFEDMSGNGLFALADDKSKIELTTGFGNEIYRWNNGQQQPQLLFKQAQSGGFSEILSPDERFLCFAANMNNKLYLRLLDLKIPNRELALAYPERKYAFGAREWESMPVFSGDGQRLAWGDCFWELPSGKLLGSQQHLSKGLALALNPQGTVLLRRDSEGLQLFEPMNGKHLRQLGPDANSIWKGAWSPDGRYIALPRRNIIEIYDVQLNRLMTTLYAWPVTTNSKDHKPCNVSSDWLAVTPNGHASGTAKAKALVHTVQ